MAGIDDCLEQTFKVTTPVLRGLARYLPAKGSTFRFEKDGRGWCLVVRKARSEKRFGGFELRDGRLERTIPVMKKLLTIELAKVTPRGKVRIKGKLWDKNMQGTWGAESGTGGGGGGGTGTGTGVVYPGAPA